MRRARPVLLLCILVACGQRSAPPAPAVVLDAAPATDAAPAATTTPDAGAPSREARLAYRKHLAAGRKAAAARAWGEAAASFEAALVALPYDGRALSELAWAAFNAGDFARARTAGVASVLAASDPRVKASALYNLGRVEEATSATARAARLYRQSLALRPNKTVEARLAGLDRDGAARDDADDGRFCATPRPAAEICACLVDHAAAWDRDLPDDQRACSVEPEGALPGFRIARVKTSFDSEAILLVAGADAGGWSVVATLAEVFNPGAFGVFEDWKLVSMTEETLGDRRVVKVVGEHTRQDTDLGIQEIESLATTRLTLCVRGPVGTTCPLEVPLRHTRARDRLDVGDDDAPLDEETRRLQTPGLPLREATELRVDLAADGTATVVLVKGRAEPGTTPRLGPHRLW